MYLARICAFKGQYDTAIEQYTDLIKHYKSKSSIFHNEIGLVYFLNGDYESAIGELTKALEVSAPEDRMFNESEIFLNLSMSYAKMGRQDEALKIISRQTKIR